MEYMEILDIARLIVLGLRILNDSVQQLVQLQCAFKIRSPVLSKIFKQISRVLSREYHALNMGRRAPFPFNHPNIRILGCLDANFSWVAAHLQHGRLDGEFDFTLCTGNDPARRLSDELRRSAIVDAGDGAVVEDTLNEHVIRGLSWI